MATKNQFLLKKLNVIFAFLLSSLLAFSATGCSLSEASPNKSNTTAIRTVSIDNVPEYSGTPYIEIDNNTPNFSDCDLACAYGTEIYSELDSLGRCGAAFGIIGTETMPADGEVRGSIGSIKPTGWQSVRYDVVGEGSSGYLYNRCHLLAWMLSSENDNEKNLITGTRYMNTEGMLPFETKVCDYIKSTRNHVAMRVTPLFEGDNLVASGVQMEAYSIEDNGEGVSFNVYCYNVQDGIEINYATGESTLASEAASTTDTETATVDTSSTEKQTYVLNTNTMKFHYEDCSKVSDIKVQNKKTVIATRDEVIADNYTPCGVCKP
jgi:DNA-entry nuclease